MIPTKFKYGFDIPNREDGKKSRDESRAEERSRDP